MLFHLSVFFATVLFVVGMLFGSFSDVFLPWVLVVLLLVTARYAWGLRQSLPSPLHIPSLYAFSSIFLMSFISTLLERLVFTVFASIVYYLLLLGLYRLSRAPRDLSARAMVAMSAMATMFFFYSAAYGFYINFAIPLWLFMTLYGIASSLVSYQYLCLVSANRKTVSVYSLVIALALAEIAWVVNFWPFGYLTSGVIVLMFFYVLFDLAQSEMIQALSRRRTLGYIGLFFCLLLMVLWSSRWRIIA